MSYPEPTPVTTAPMLVDSTLAAQLHRELFADKIKPEQPGAAVAVYRDGVLVASAAAGVADTETGALFTERTRTNIASVSKQIVATTVLLAARRGELDLDADVRALVPELTVPGATLRGCLGHTTGLPDYFAVIDLMGSTEIEMSGLNTFLHWLGTVDTLDFAPGTGQSYSNTGYVVAALAAERASGIPFPELIRATVFEPLGMHDTLVTTLLGEFHEGMAMSFSPEGEGFTRWPMGIGDYENERVVNGDGEVITTLADFANWHGFLLDGRVLGRDIRSQLLERTVLQDGRVSTYALGIEHEQRGETRALAHSGGMWGYSTYSLVDPVSGVSIALFANRDDLEAIELAWQAFRIATGAGGLSGRWFSRSGFSGVRLRVLGTGDLGATTGEEEVRLRHVGAGRWHRDDDFSLTEVIDGELYISTAFGISEAYDRLHAAGPFPAHAYGSYTEPFRGATVALEARDGKPWLVTALGKAEPVNEYGSRGDEWIGSCALGWIVIPAEAAGVVAVGEGSVTVRLRRTD